VQTDRDQFFEAIDQLDRALDESVEMTQRMKERIRHLREAGASGRPLREIVSREEPPLLVQLLTQSSALLQSCGTQVRRTEVRTLYGEGMTMDEIAELFGVSRQRVSALLHERASAT
jgi:plasmid maintenance system antidote protein VapI